MHRKFRVNIELQKIAVGIVKLGKNQILPLEGVGGLQLIRQFSKIFYHLLDGKFQIHFT